MQTILFDIDGTLANLNGREKFIHQPRPDWQSFNAHMDEDIPNLPLATLYRALYESGKFEIILVSGRQERYRKLTETWLTWHDLPFKRLLMRSDRDMRQDWQVKQDILKQLQAEGKEILFSVDDRQSVVDMWRANGITCLQCAKGNY